MHDFVIGTHLDKWGSVGVLPLAENQARGFNLYCHSELGTKVGV